MAAPEPAAALTRHALIPLSLVVCFALVYGLRVAPWWVAVVGVPMVALYVLAPRIGRRSLARFDRAAVPLLSTKDADALRARFAWAIGMRLFAAPARVAERRGLVAAETGAFDRARVAYREAVAGYPEDHVPVAVRLGLAHACYALKDDHEAIRLYREILRSEGSFPRVERRLAHALGRRGEDLKEAARLADEARRQSDDPEAKLIRALIHAKRGQRGPARKLLRATRDAEDLDALREDVEVALEEI
ncbi:MAG: hypothetical protein H6719_12065 [Sandaracinaceae bacterium]|nr:hypothetical protein [Sandaracinaceae bacterium]